MLAKKKQKVAGKWGQSTLTKVPHWEKDPRWPRFVSKLMELQNACEAARQAGYSESTAKVHSHIMAARVLDGVKGALWRKGMAVDRMADKLIQLFDCEKPKWNVRGQKWDYFQNTGAQLAAFDRIKTVLEPDPPKRLEVDVLIGVKRDQTRDKETAEEWQARNEARRKAATKIGQALLPAGMASGEKGASSSSKPNGGSGSVNGGADS